ncbi:hypothetical protein [Microcoleus sp. herbarium2]|uniref:hypothetical protein n=1 Tax=Microcoleus sp. herbarium2 TaxID=3055433 RepID=UPI002FD32B15
MSRSNAKIRKFAGDRHHALALIPLKHLSLILGFAIISSWHKFCQVIILSCQLPIAATLLLRCVSGVLVEDCQQPTPKAYAPVRAISTIFS